MRGPQSPDLQIPHPSSCWNTNQKNGQSQALLDVWFFFLFCRVEWVHEVAPVRWPLSGQRELGMCLTITLWPADSNGFSQVALTHCSGLWPDLLVIGKWPIPPTRYPLQATSHLRHLLNLKVSNFKGPFQTKDPIPEAKGQIEIIGFLAFHKFLFKL